MNKVSSGIWREIFTLLIAGTLSLALQIVILDPTFNGPDAISNFQFAEAGQSISYWLDPTAFWGYLFPMGYGTFLALATRITGGDYLPIQIFQIGIGLSMAYLGWLITRNLGRLIRILTFVTIAFCPATIVLARMNGYEIFLGFFIMLSFTLILAWNPPFRVLLMASIAGTSMGLAMMFQGKSLVLLPLLSILYSRRFSHGLWLFLTSSCVLPAAWGIRNYFVIGTWNPFNSSSGVVMWMGNNPKSIAGEYVVSPPPLPEGSSSFYEASLNFIVSQPERAFELLLFRMSRLLQPPYIYLDLIDIPIIQIALHFVFIVMYAFIAIVFFSFIFGRIWVSPPVLPPVTSSAVLVLLFGLAHIPFATEIRHIQPVIPIALTVVVPTTIYLIRRWTRHLDISRSGRQTRGRFEVNGG